MRRILPEGNCLHFGGRPQELKSHKLVKIAGFPEIMNPTFRKTN